MTGKSGAVTAPGSEISDLRFRERHDNDIIELHPADDHDPGVPASDFRDIEDLALEIDSMNIVAPVLPVSEKQMEASVADVSPEPLQNDSVVTTTENISEQSEALSEQPAVASIMLSEEDFYVTGSDGFGDIHPSSILELFREKTWSQMTGEENSDDFEVIMKEPSEAVVPEIPAETARELSVSFEPVSEVDTDSGLEEEFAVIEENDDDVIHIGDELFADDDDSASKTDPVAKEKAASDVVTADDSDDDLIISVSSYGVDADGKSEEMSEEHESFHVELEDNDAVVVDPAELIDGVRSLPQFEEMSSSAEDALSQSDHVDNAKADFLPDDISLVHFEAPETGEEMPDDFELVPIDLDEARAVAEEDILFLTEDDLIEELDARDLVPLDETPAERTAPEQETHADKAAVALDVTWVTPARSWLNDDDRTSIKADCQANRVLVIEEELEDQVAEGSTESELVDITDRVIIIEDESSVDDFVATLDPSKQEEMRRLLAYLDGLFEKLPEDAVRNFAGSEYFDLYVRVMNELGV